jgi:hypothetical protein
MMIQVRDQGCFVLDRSRKWGLAPAVPGQVPVSISETDRVTLGQTKGTGTSLRSGARPHFLAQRENETALGP